MKTYLGTMAIGVICCACSTQPSVEWVSTTERLPWEMQADLQASQGKATAEVIVDLTQEEQTMEGFGTCFNELGWTSLCALEPQVREGIMQELFSPGVGANFTICRMPVAANDFARNWYSYNETDRDFEMAHFSIENDRETLIPFIKNAMQYLPDIRIWASPWSPPSWMKYNKHYASRSMAPILKRAKAMEAEARKKAADPTRPSGESTYHFKLVDNGLPDDPSRQGQEGTDMFIQEAEYLKAYALYFSKFIDAYRNEGIDIFAVMPQNEFNSAQIFPSCCWTAAGLANFIGQYLGPAMKEKGVEVMFGTMERANELLVDTILNDPACRPYITGVGFQWAGKEAIPGIHRRYPQLKLYQTEQECGNGKNDWKGAVYSWNLMKHYLNNGATAYMYWNTSLLEGGISRWGWAQNSLVIVNEAEKTFAYTPEYYVMKHVSHYVLPGAVKLKTSGSYGDVLAFRNPDNSLVIVAGNETPTAQTVSFKLNDRVFTPVLKANSFNTLYIRNL